MLGPAPVADFDGTIARLVGPWAELRSELGVSVIEDLWEVPDHDGWDRVRDFEVTAARTAAPVAVVERALVEARSFAVLTSNSEHAVHEFLGRFPDLAVRAAAVIGRETLGGPKTSPAVFERGFRLCVAATAEARGTGPIVYVGDREYELELARRFGATQVHDVAALEVERA
jgi:phosphoglycolate phosphatase-like HAD superfamily hydrolase